MSQFKPQQRRLSIRGRIFHFVSYEARPADPRHDQVAEPSMWYLMCEGRRLPAIPAYSEQSEEETDAVLRDWVENNAVEPCADVKA